MEHTDTNGFVKRTDDWAWTLDNRILRVLEIEVHLRELDKPPSTAVDIGLFGTKSDDPNAEVVHKLRPLVDSALVFLAAKLLDVRYPGISSLSGFIRERTLCDTGKSLRENLSPLALSELDPFLVAIETAIDRALDAAFYRAVNAASFLRPDAHARHYIEKLQTILLHFQYSNPEFRPLVVVHAADHTSVDMDAHRDRLLKQSASRYDRKVRELDAACVLAHYSTHDCESGPQVENIEEDPWGRDSPGGCISM